MQCWDERRVTRDEREPRPILPRQGLTNQVSRNTYISSQFLPLTLLIAKKKILFHSLFIRSRIDPRDFRHIPLADKDAGIPLISRTNRTCFHITATHTPKPLNGGTSIMISSEALEIVGAGTSGLVGIDTEAGCLALMGAMVTIVEIYGRMSHSLELCV